VLLVLAQVLVQRVLERAQALVQRALERARAPAPVQER
tara:strand:- start:804 stop:917 length:114 start_codon:yes stop_codon:yes gene_type:complete